MASAFSACNICRDDAKPPTHVPSTGNGNSTDDSRARKLERLETQLEALDNFLDGAKTADEWHKLSTAKHRLLENYYILAGIPKPGSRRPGKDSRPNHPPGAWLVRPAPTLAPVPVG
jgi:hypothetical protein